MAELAWWRAVDGAVDDIPFVLPEPFALMRDGRARQAGAAWATDAIGRPFWSALALTAGGPADAPTAVAALIGLDAPASAEAIRRDLAGRGLPVPRGPRSTARANSAGPRARTRRPASARAGVVGRRDRGRAHPLRTHRRTSRLRNPAQARRVDPVEGRGDRRAPRPEPVTNIGRRLDVAGPGRRSLKRSAPPLLAGGKPCRCSSTSTPSTATVINRGMDLDLFTTAADGRIMSTTWTQSAGWAPSWFNVAGGRASLGSPVTALVRIPSHIDLFVVGEDNRIYSTHWDSGFPWAKDWFVISNGKCQARRPDARRPPFRSAWTSSRWAATRRSTPPAGTGRTAGRDGSRWE